MVSPPSSRQYGTASVRADAQPKIRSCGACKSGSGPKFVPLSIIARNVRRGNGRVQSATDSGDAGAGPETGAKPARENAADGCRSVLRRRFRYRKDEWTQAG